MVRPVADSCCRNSWVLRAMRALKSVGSPRASSRALVCSDWVCPWVAAMASTQVRMTLLNTSWAVSDHPDVWQWVRSDNDLSLVGENCFTSFAHSSRAARILATSVKKCMPMAQKNDSRGAKASMVSPASSPARMYSMPSARVYPSSRSAEAPASCMWYQEMEMELNRGISTEV